MKITVETFVKSTARKAWDAWNTPSDIKRWNTAQDDWYTSRGTVDLREGGKFLARMEAKDGSQGFDFEGTYTRIVPHWLIEYRLNDGREVRVEFIEDGKGVSVRETFDAETENTPELQERGRHVEGKASSPQRG